MVERVIPEQRVFVCDVCEQEDGPRVKKAQLILKRHALDWYGEAAADGTCKFDLCDKCETLMSKAINTAIVSLRCTQTNKDKQYYERQ